MITERMNKIFVLVDRGGLFWVTEPWGSKIAQKSKFLEFDENAPDQIDQRDISNDENAPDQIDQRDISNDENGSSNGVTMTKL
jgi:hypothetical protein